MNEKLFGKKPKHYRLKKHISQTQFIAYGFFLIIMTGSLLLMLPIASRDGQSEPFLNCLFTAASASCVTGLVVADTWTQWSLFGQMVLLVLIQLGGLGFISIGIFLSIVLRRKIGLKERGLMQESVNTLQIGGMVKLAKKIIIGTAIFEGAGAVILSCRFIPEYGLVRGTWYGIFHSVSAFCNAGFDLMGETGAFSSLTGYVGDPLVNLVICLLIVVGGLGFLTWHDVAAHGRHVSQYRLQSKLILLTTLALLVGGFLFFRFYEFSRPQWAALTGGERGLAALFQSVSPRTAGFNTVDLTQLSACSQLMTILLMLAGGSPGSTAGGFKTTTLAVLLLSVGAVIRRQGSARCFGRRLPDQVLRNACAIFLLYLVLFLAGGMLICCMDEIPLMQALFEAASAIGTVGLSLGATAEASEASRLILIFLMYFGRVGGLTMIYAMAAGSNGASSQYPQEQVTVG